MVTKREKSKESYMGNRCVEETKHQGVERVGIYHVTEVAVGIQMLKAASQIVNKNMSMMMNEMDINTLICLLKLSFY